MSLDDQHSADDTKNMRSKNISNGVDGQTEIFFKKSKTINNIRKDRFGSPIKRGGKHKICFRDKIQGNKLCDVVNITLLNNDSYLSKNVSAVKKMSINSNSSNCRLNSNTDINKLNEIINKASKNLTPKKENDENCSCACLVF